MAMKKAEMEAQHKEYSRFVLEARSAVERLEFRESIRLAECSWEFIDGMLQFEKRFLSSEKVNIHGLTIVFHYSPLLLDFEILERLESFLESTPRVKKNSDKDVIRQLEESRECLAQSHKLWGWLDDRKSIYMDDVKNSKSSIKKIVAFWVETGIAKWIPKSERQVLKLVTHLQEIIRGKCSFCGVCVQAQKSKLLDTVVCPNCKQRMVFTLLADQVSQASKESHQ